MENFVLDWALLLVRWLHVIVAIAWIGASFYFVWLDNSLQQPTDPELIKKGVNGELWAVHGGGFYNPQKYMVAPGNLPKSLHWFYWESYSTWLSGFAMFVLLYLFNPRAYLIDPRVYAMSSGLAVGLALAFLVSGWSVYDGICRIFGQDNRKVGILTALAVVVAAYVASRLFAGRAAFLLTGAMMATIMTANVFFWIIPGQRKVIASMRAGEKADPIHGLRGKQRSVHNTYFTLPVLLAMLSNHYTILTTHPYNWILLLLLMVASVLIRQFFLLKHKGKINYWFPAAGAAVIFGVAVWTLPANSKPQVDTSNTQSAVIAPKTETLPLGVAAIVKERCTPCHSLHPTLFAVAPKNMTLDQPEEILAHAQLIYQHVVVEKSMPVGNLTKITDDERGIIQKWYETRAQ
ncbi:MAG: urate hydroxylase PuuD [Chitinophagaceae bacterium]|nr:urate hydroxylase PuuD [Oligoflexus sp.]